MRKKSKTKLQPPSLTIFAHRVTPHALAHVRVIEMNMTMNADCWPPSSGRFVVEQTVFDESAIKSLRTSQKKKQLRHFVFYHSRLLSISIWSQLDKVRSSKGTAELIMNIYRSEINK